MPPVGYKAIIVAAMPGTVPEIVASSGMTESTVKRWIRILHAAGEIYISGWQPHPRAGAHMAVYSIGNLPDAKCKLKTLTKRQIRLRYEAKAKEDGRYDVLRAHWRSRYWERKAAAVGDPMVAALFGVAPERESSLQKQ